MNPAHRFKITERPFSWSQLSSWEYSPEQWYDSYVLGIKQTSPEMDFGSLVDKKLQDESSYLPKVPRYPVMQLKMEAMLNGVPLVGYADGWHLGFPELGGTHQLADYKTGKKLWTQKRTDETGQLTFYALLLYLMDKIKPEDIRFFIHWLPTQENGDFTIGFTPDFEKTGKPVTFETKRTMTEILLMTQRIAEARRAMAEYVKERQRTEVRP